MPIIQRDYISGNAENRKDLVLRITARETGRSFDFRVTRNRVEVECTNPVTVKPGEKAVNDWKVSLTEHEKLRVFALILDEYRKHSIGDEHGYRGAVLGVSNRGDIFLGANTATEQVTSPYMKECAEQNMVSAASDVVAYEQVKKEGWDTTNRPKAPKFESLYMMGGVDGGRVPVSCPCGMCTDMLAKNMTKNAKIYALPILSPESRDYLNSKSEPYVREVKPDPALVAKRIRRGEAPPTVKTKVMLTSNGVISPAEIRIDTSLTLADVRAQVSDASGLARKGALTPYPVWQTTIQHLNASRVLALEPERVRLQQNGSEAIIRRAFSADGLPEESAARTHDKLLGNPKRAKRTGEGKIRDLFASLLQVVADGYDGMRQDMIGLFQKENAPLIRKAAENQFLARDSIPELDCAVREDGVDLAAVNRFMVGRITHTLADRVRSRHTKAEQSAPTDWIRKHIESVRCVVVQLDDGTFHSAVQASGTFDPSMANAEVAVLEQATPSLGRYGVRHVWAMEFNPADIAKGQLTTSPKEGLERLIKRASTSGIDFTYLPLNSGKHEAQFLERVSARFDDKTLFPALFKGSRPVNPVDMRPPAAWQALVEQQAGASPGQRRA